MTMKIARGSRYCGKSGKDAPNGRSGRSKLYCELMLF